MMVTALLICITTYNSNAQNSKTAKIPKMKMTTEIPEGIPTPNHIESRIGVLNSTIRFIIWTELCLTK